MVPKCHEDLIALKTYVQGQAMNNNLGDLGAFNEQTVYLDFQLSSYPNLCQIKKQSDKNFLSLNQKYEQNLIFAIFGGPGCPYVKPMGTKMSGQ